MTLPSYIEVQRQELAETPGVQRIFVGRDETFFISGQVSASIVADELGAELNRQRQGKGLAELSMRLRVVRVLEALQQSLDESRRTGVSRTVALSER